jgi:hypothetical protein
MSMPVRRPAIALGLLAFFGGAATNAAFAPEPRYRTGDFRLQAIEIPSRARDSVELPDLNALAAAVEQLKARRLPAGQPTPAPADADPRATACRTPTTADAPVPGPRPAVRVVIVSETIEIDARFPTAVVSEPHAQAETAAGSGEAAAPLERPSLTMPG